MILQSLKLSSLNNKNIYNKKKFNTYSFLFFFQINAQEIQRLNELGYPIKETTLEHEFIKGEIIIKFKEGYINTTVLKSNASKFSSAQAQKTNTSPSVKEPASFFSHFTNNKMRKVVTKYKTSYGKSTSRLGATTKNSNFQNLMILF